jgi:hypothetical protein
VSIQRLIKSGASRRNRQPTNKGYSPRRDRASTSSCLTFVRLDCHCSSSSTLGGWLLRALSARFRLNSSLRRAVTRSELSFMGIVDALG